MVAEAVVAERPSILLIGATPDGRDLAGRLAVRLRTGLTDCTGLDLEFDTGLLLGHTTGFGGGVTATIKCPVHRPQMATVRPGVFLRPIPDPTRDGRIERRPVWLSLADLRVEILDRTVGLPDVDLTRAKVVVVGARGVAGDFPLLKELAACSGVRWARRVPRSTPAGPSASSRSVRRATSRTWSWRLSVASVVAVNTDPEAPISSSWKPST